MIERFSDKKQKAANADIPLTPEMKNLLQDFIANYNIRDIWETFKYKENAIGDWNYEVNQGYKYLQKGYEEDVINKSTVVDMVDVTERLIDVSENLIKELSNDIKNAKKALSELYKLSGELDLG